MRPSALPPGGASSRPLRVGIDSRIVSGAVGGVEQAIVGLARGLSALPDGDEEYYFYVYGDQAEWLRPHASGPCRVIEGPTSEPPRMRLKMTLRKLPGVDATWQVVGALGGPKSVPIPKSDGRLEGLGCEVIHFPSQRAFLTARPSIYQPYDLQHMHLPHLFSPRTRLQRTVTYRLFCHRASVVAVASSAAKEDLISLLKVEPEKIHVIPIAAVNSARDLDGVGQLPAIPWAAGEFAFFPAQTFPHKNHEALLVALALLRDRSGLRIPIVCSGALSPHYRKVQRMVTRLRLADQVAFLGQISPAGVSALYGSCRLVIFPTLFEGWGLPATEAQASGAPLVCSRIRPLTDIAGAAAQYFNPEDPADIARGLSEVWLDDNLRKRLAAAGLLRAGSFTWDRTARIFRAWYRRLADRPTDVDRSLIEMEPAV